MTIVLADTQARYVAMVQKLQEAIPTGSEASYSTTTDQEPSMEARKQKLLELVPEDQRKACLEEGIAATDDEAFHLINQLHKRAGLRTEMFHLSIMFLSHPFWKPVMEKASRSDAAKAKKAAAKTE
jgi:hypothetical protein